VTRLSVPREGVVSLHGLPSGAAPWVVLVTGCATLPDVPGCRAIAGRGLWVEPEDGATWPDEVGEAAAVAALANGGAVALAFADEADAEECRRRLVARSAH
jgi:hypothetical protein